MDDRYYEKLFTELWDAGNISTKEFDAIKSLIENCNIDLTKRWNIKQEIK